MGFVSVLIVLMLPTYLSLLLLYVCNCVVLVVALLNFSWTHFEATYLPIVCLLAFAHS
jgi:hypothetical protein